MLPPLDWLRSFESAARTLNFTAAGRELGLTQAAVSQHIKLLEDWLGRPLFGRLRRGVALSPDGAAYLPHVQAAFAAILRSTDALFGPDRRRTIGIRGPISFMTLWLAPRLADLAAALPHIGLKLSTMHLPADYDAPGIDFDVRFGTGGFPGRTSHRLTTERLVPMAAPGVPDGPARDADWTALPLLSVAGAREMWPDWFAAAGLPPPVRMAVQCDSFIVAYEAARHGAGALLGARALAHAALADGSLRTLSAVELPSEAGHFLTFAAGRPLGDDEAVLLDWLVGQGDGGGGRALSITSGLPI